MIENKIIDYYNKDNRDRWYGANFKMEFGKMGEIRWLPRVDDGDGDAGVPETTGYVTKELPNLLGISSKELEILAKCAFTCKFVDISCDEFCVEDFWSS